MGGGGKSSGGGYGGSTYQQSTVTIPPEVLARYNAVNARAENVANQPFVPYGGQFVAPLSNTQADALQGLYTAAGSYQPFYQSATDALASGVNAAAPWLGQAGANYGYAQGLGNQLGFGAIDAMLGASAASNPLIYGSGNTMNQALGAGMGYLGGAGSAGQSAYQQGQALTPQAYASLAAGNSASTPLHYAGLNTAQSGYGSAQPFNGAAASNILTALAAGQPWLMQAGGLNTGAAGAVDPRALDIAKYQSPYLKDVVDTTMANLYQQQDRDQSSVMGDQMMRGAFGGGSSMIERALLAKQQGMGAAQVEAGLRDAAYRQALGAAQQQQGVYLGAEQANRAALAQAANTALGISQQAFNQPFQAANAQAALGNQIYNQGLGLGGFQSGVGSQLFGQGLATSQQQGNLANQLYNQGMGYAGLLGNLGTSAFGMGSTAAAHQLGMGQQLFNQGAATSQQIGNIGNQLFQNNAMTGQLQQGLGSGIFGMGAGASQQLANLGSGFLNSGLAANQALLAGGTLEQQTQQALNSALYNQFLQQQGYPFQVAQFLANIAMGTGALSGSTTQGTTSQGSPFFSDRDLKENVDKIGTTHSGQPIYRFNYKGRPGETQIGLMAQDVEKRHPDAVGLAGGFKTVDYAAATEDDVRRRRAEGGGANDALSALVLAQRGIFPHGASGAPYGGGAGPFGATGQRGPYGVGLAGGNTPTRIMHTASLPSVPQQRERPGFMDNLNSLANTGKNIAGLYKAGKEVAVGSAKGEDGQPTGGLFGKGGKWDTDQGWLSDWFGSSSTSPIEAPVPEPGGLYMAHGGRAHRDMGGGLMPYSAGALGDTFGYGALEELSKPKEPPKLEPAKLPDLPQQQQGGRGGQGGGVGKALGAAASLASLIPGVGAVAGPVGALLSFLPFKAGGRVGFQEGGTPGFNAPGIDVDEIIKSLNEQLGRSAPSSGPSMSRGAMAPNLPPRPSQEDVLGSLKGALADGALPPLPDLPAPGGLFPAPPAPGVTVFPAARDNRGGDPDGMGVLASPSGAFPSVGLGAATPPAPPALPPQDGAAQPGAAVPHAPAAVPPLQSRSVGLAPSVREVPAAVPSGSDLPTAPASRGGFDDAVAFTLKHEGGFNPSDANGSPVNFGINQKYHPEVDVRKITQDQARDIYKQKYWNAIGGNNLDPKIQRIAFDTAVISGPDFARKLLEQSGGDPAKFMQLREAHEKGLIARDPDRYGKYATAWANRRRDLWGGPVSDTPAPSRAPSADPALPPDVARALAMTNPVSNNLSGRPNQGIMDWLTSERTIVPLLAGIGGMLSSRSPQLLPALGEGLVAGAGAYGSLGRDTRRQDIMQQQADTNTMGSLSSILQQLYTQEAIEKKASTTGAASPDTLANIKRVQDMIIALGTRTRPQGGVTPVGLPAPAASEPPALRAVPQPGAPTQPAAAPTPTPTARDPGAPTVVDWTRGENDEPADPLYNIEKLRNDLRTMRDPVERERTLNEIARIEQTGQIKLANGRTAFAKGFNQARTEEQNRTANREWQGKQGAEEETRKRALAGLNILSGELSKFQTNKAAQISADVQAWMKSAGFNVPNTSMTSADSVQEIKKQIAQLAAAEGNTDLGRALVELGGVEAIKEPAPNRKILAQAIGSINHADAKYKYVMEQLGKKPHADRAEIMRQWEADPVNSRDRYIDEAFKNTPVAGDVPLKWIDGQGYRPDVGVLKDGALYILTPEQLKQMGIGSPAPVTYRFIGGKLQRVQ